MTDRPHRRRPLLGRSRLRTSWTPCCCGRRAARLRLAERVQAETQTGFVHGVGPVRRATAWDEMEAEARIANTAWRARVIARRRSCPAPQPKQRAGSSCGAAATARPRRRPLASPGGCSSRRRGRGRASPRSRRSCRTCAPWRRHRDDHRDRRAPDAHAADRGGGSHRADRQPVRAGHPARAALPRRPTRLFQEDLAWNEGRGYIVTGPLDEEVWIALTAAGREIIDLMQPGPARRCIALGRGAYLALYSPLDAISASKLDTLAAAARSLVDTVLGDSVAAPDQGAKRNPGSHLGAREQS